MFNEEANKYLEEQKKLTSEVSGFSCQHHPYNSMDGRGIFSSSSCRGDCGSIFTRYNKPHVCETCHSQKHQEIEKVWKEAQKLKKDWDLEHAFCQKDKDKEEFFAERINWYLKDNDFKKLTLNNDEMIIEFTNSQRQNRTLKITSLPTMEMEAIAYHMKKKGLKQIEYPLNKQSVQNGGSGNPSNYLPYLFGALAVLLVFGIIYYFYRRSSNKKQTKREI